MLILKPLSIDRSVAGAKIPAVTFIAPTGLTTHELAHMLDSLVRVSRRVERIHLLIKPCQHGYNQAHSHTRGHATMCLEFSPRTHGWWHAGQEAQQVSWSHHTDTLALSQRSITLTCNNLTKPHWLHSLPFQQVQALLTLFSKSFSSFPHGTCSLSVSNQYLALDGIYHPICAPIPRNVTLRKYTVHRGLQMMNGILTLTDAFFQKTYTCASVGSTTSDYNSRPEAPIFMLSSSLFIRHYWGNPI